MKKNLLLNSIHKSIIHGANMQNILNKIKFRKQKRFIQSNNNTSNKLYETKCINDILLSINSELTNIKTLIKNEPLNNKKLIKLDLQSVINYPGFIKIYFSITMLMVFSGAFGILMANITPHFSSYVEKKCNDIFNNNKESDK